MTIAERVLIKTVDIVITVNEFIMKELKDKYKLKSNIYTILNVLSHNIEPLSQKVVSKKYFNVIYQGVLSEGRGLEELCQAMQYTNNNPKLWEVVYLWFRDTKLRSLENLLLIIL
ncbi:hypothetical protein ES705_48514 [subsurface metagenome]